MAKSRDLRVRGFLFTVDIVRLCREHLAGDPIIRRLAYQLVDSAGSIGANLEESGAGHTKPDFIAKQAISLKEARESRFWLRVLAAAYPPVAPTLASHLQESTELVAMITASILTAKSNPHRGAPQPDDGGGDAGEMRNGKWGMGNGKWQMAKSAGPPALPYAIYHLPSAPTARGRGAVTRSARGFQIACAP
jgi:four helix bundle protein